MKTWHRIALAAFGVFTGYGAYSIHRDMSPGFIAGFRDRNDVGILFGLSVISFWNALTNWSNK